jgi:hypothetical protein
MFEIIGAILLGGVLVALVFTLLYLDIQAGKPGK